MAYYNVVFERAAWAWIKKQSHEVRKQIGYDLWLLQRDEDLVGVGPLSGIDHTPPLMKLRSGDYRIVYYRKDGLLVIVVLTIADRKEVYQKLKLLLKNKPKTNPPKAGTKRRRK